MVVDDRIRRDAERVIDRGENVGRMNRVFGGRRACRVRLAVDLAGFDAATCDQRRVAVGPVVAAIRGVAVAGSRNILP